MSEAPPSTVSIRLRISDPKGLHWRPAGKLASLVNDVLPKERFDVVLGAAGKTLDPRSMMTVGTAGFTNNQRITLDIYPIDSQIISDEILQRLREELPGIGLQELTPSHT